MGLGDLPLFIDHVGDAPGVDVARGLGGAVGHADAAVGVAEEGEGELELLGEGLVLFLGVEADAEDLGVLGCVLLAEVPEPGTLARSTRGVGLRVEPEDDFLAPEVAELDAIAVVVGDFEIGSLLSGLEHARFSSKDGLQDALERHARIVRS